MRAVGEDEMMIIGCMFLALRAWCLGSGVDALEAEGVDPDLESSLDFLSFSAKEVRTLV